MRLKSLAKRVVGTAIGRDFFIEPDIDVDYIVLGSSYGGWPVLPSLTTRDAIVYSFGIGEDITFDLALINAFECKVEAFDPTPKSMKWIERQDLPSGFRFHPIGIAAKNGEITFYPPVNPAHVSFTAKKNDSSTGEPTIAPVNDLQTIMGQLGHTHVDIVKMDVEGTEYEVVKALGDCPARPTQLMVEFHHAMYGYRVHETLDAIAALRRLGYRLYYRSESGHEFAFVHDHAIGAARHGGVPAQTG